MIQNKFTVTAGNVLKGASREAGELGHTYIGTEHLLLSMTKDHESVGGGILSAGGIEYEATKNLIREISGTGEKTNPDSSEMTPMLKRVIEVSSGMALKYGHSLIGTEDLLLALLTERESVAVKLLVAQNISINELQNDIISFFGDVNMDADISVKKSKGSVSAIGKFGRDLTAYASMGLLDPIIGRETETERVIQILSRRTKNNPCLIGEPGVGKTAVVEGLAERIASGNVPENLAEKTVIALDIGSMIAGAKYRGEFEDRLKNVMDEVMKNRNIILFIDEIHTIVGAGAAEGAVDAANILKPALARGAIRLIGATTLTEYRKIEKDGALERRFQPILVKEPSTEETLTILRGVRESFEAHHRIAITDEALQAAVELSVRYLPDRRLPDKAIDLIDEAAACMRVRLATPPNALRELERSTAKLTEAKEIAIRKQDFTEAGRLRAKEIQTRNAFTTARRRWEKDLIEERASLGRAEIVARLAELTGIPIPCSDLVADQLPTEEALSKRIIGQKEALCKVVAALRRRSAGLLSGGRPAGSFLFIGPSGVGKTEMAKALAELLFGSKNAMIRLDLSEYREAHSIARLIGAPPGYVGYDEGGLLTEKIRRTPYAVVVFDEIEKAHPDLSALLLQILEEGCLTDSAGRKADFSNAYILITSNIASPHPSGGGTVGFLREEQTDASVSRLKKTFSPELLSRIDEIIPFRMLEPADLAILAERMLTDLRYRIRERVELCWEEEACRHLAELAYRSPEGGARSLKSLIRQKVEDQLALCLLSPPVPPALWLVLQDKELLLTPLPPANCREKCDFFQKNP